MRQTAQISRYLDGVTAFPKADALPGCATPRLRKALSLGRFPASMGKGIRCNSLRLVSFHCATSPGIVPAPVPAMCGRV